MHPIWAGSSNSNGGNYFHIFVFICCAIIKVNLASKRIQKILQHSCRWTPHTNKGRGKALEHILIGGVLLALRSCSPQERVTYTSGEPAFLRDFGALRSSILKLVIITRAIVQACLPMKRIIIHMSLLGMF